MQTPALAPAKLLVNRMDLHLLNYWNPTSSACEFARPKAGGRSYFGEFDRESIQKDLSAALATNVPIQDPRDYWLAAKFCKETVLAHVSSDSTLEFGLNTAMLRYGQPLDLPLNGPNTLFCDILLHQ
jgi:hypothetical protein